jgi:hypothetical protein
MNENDRDWHWASGDYVGVAEANQFREKVTLKRARRDFEKRMREKKRVKGKKKNCDVTYAIVSPFAYYY